MTPISPAPRRFRLDESPQLVEVNAPDSADFESYRGRYLAPLQHPIYRDWVDAKILCGLVDRTEFGFLGAWSHLTT
jgi:hypothetical protein